jgi:hypothetical protein
MDDKELAFIYASIQIRVEEEKKQTHKMKAHKSSAKGGGRRG